MGIEFTAAGAYVTCEGNSLTAGAGSTGGQSYPAQLQLLAPIDGATVRAAGASGQTTLRMTEYTGPIADNYYRADRTLVIVAWEGTNSISQTGAYAERTAAQALAEMQQYVADRLAKGPMTKVILLTTIPRMGGFWGTAVGNQHLLEYNQGVMDSAASWGVSHVVDVRQEGSPFRFTGYSDADFNAASVAPYWADGETTHIHLNNAGYAVIAQMVADGLTALGVPVEIPSGPGIRLAGSGRVRLRGAGKFALTAEA